MKQGIKEFIKERVIELHKEVSVDKYGQVHTSSFTPSVFGDRIEEVLEFCKVDSSVIIFSTYGGRFGQYKAFKIIDKDLKRASSEALRKNEGFIRAMTTW